MLYVPLPILNILEYFYVERMGAVDDFGENSFILINNVCNLLFIMSIMKAILDEFMFTIIDTRLQVSEAIPILAAVSMLGVLILRLIVNANLINGVEPIMNLKEDFNCNTFNIRDSYPNFKWYDHIIFGGSIICIFLGLVSTISLAFNCTGFRNYDIYRISAHRSIWTRILNFGKVIFEWYASVVVVGDLDYYCLNETDTENRQKLLKIFEEYRIQNTDYKIKLGFISTSDITNGRWINKAEEMVNKEWERLNMSNNWINKYGSPQDHVRVVRNQSYTTKGFRKFFNYLFHSYLNDRLIRNHMVIILPGINKDEMRYISYRQAFIRNVLNNTYIHNGKFNHRLLY